MAQSGAGGTGVGCRPCHLKALLRDDQSHDRAYGAPHAAARDETSQGVATAWNPDGAPAVTVTTRFRMWSRVSYSVAWLAMVAEVFAAVTAVARLRPVHPAAFQPT